MPIYEFFCESHGIFEEIHFDEDRPEFARCPNYDMDDVEQCKHICKIQVSAPTMKPDKHWAGTVTASGKYVTSNKEYEKEMGHLVPATREAKEYAQKKHNIVARERQERKEDKLERFLGNQIRGFDLPSGDDNEASANAFANRMKR